jgi:hypothetical protein
MRKAILAGAGLGEVGFELLVLIGFSVLLFPIGFATFGFAVVRARKDGTLGQF